MDIIYFFYGLSFLVMGVVIFAQPRKGSGFELALGLKLLAWFGIIHGAYELFEMWSIIKGFQILIFRAGKSLCLAVSFAFLLEAGRKLAKLAYPGGPGGPGRFLAWPARRLFAVLAGMILIPSFWAADFWGAADSLSRYLICLPGAWLAGLGILGYYRIKQRVLSPLRVRRFFLIAGLGFICYGIFAGVFVPRGGFFPANWLNGEAFREILGVPVPVFRALCAVAISWGIVGMLKIFEWERSEKVDSALLENLPDAIWHVSREGRLIGMNPAASSFYGLADPAGSAGQDAAARVGKNRDEMAAAIRRAAAGGMVALEYESVGAAGQPARWSAIVAPVKGADGAVQSVLVVSRDVTDRERMEDALRSSENRFRIMFETSRDALMTLAPPAWTFASGNPATVAMFRAKDEADFTSRGPWELSPERQPDGCASAEKSREMVEAALRDGYRSFEWTHRRLDGEEFPADVLLTRLESEGKVFLQATVRDITERKRAEEALLQERIFKNTLMDNIADGVVACDAQGQLVLFNRAAREWHGMNALALPPEEWSRHYSLYEPDGITPMSTADIPLFRAFCGETVHDAGMTIVAQGQAPRHILASGGPFFDAHHNLLGAVAVMRDITERKRSVQEMQWKTALLEAQINATIDGILIVDSQGSQIIQNQQCVDLWKIPKSLAEDNDDKRQVEFVMGRTRDPEKFLEKVRYLYAHPDETSHDEVELKDGMTLDRYSAPVVGKDGTHFGRIWTFRDITERKKADLAIHESLEMQSVLNLMLQASLTNVPLRDKLINQLSELLSVPWLNVVPKGAIFLLDKNALILTAHKGLAPDVLAACANVPVGQCLCGRAAQSGKSVIYTDAEPAHEIICHERDPHGHYCAPIVAGGKTLGVVNLYLKDNAVISAKQEGFLQAATDILAANIIHAQIEEQLGQSQKMDSIGRLAGGVAHDFNNLLTAINGYASMLAASMAQDDPKRGDVKEIIAAGERAAGLTRQLLAFSRRQILDLQVRDINAAVGGTLKMLQRLIGEDIKLETSLAAQPCLARVDAGQIDQVLLNLVVNARDAMAQGGTLALEIKAVAVEEAFWSRHPDMARGPLVRLSVRDTGCGMDDTVKAHLFEPFFTTKEKGKGTGLGLAMVFGIIKQSGGEIEVESAVGRGSTFRIYLPQIEDWGDAAGTDKDKEGDREAGDSFRGNETVLFVEDEDTVRRLAERVLNANGYTVLAAASGPEALAVLERHGRPVDLLITDVVMPGMNGRELAQDLARRKLVRRIIYISGYTDEAIVKHGVLTPGLAFLPKPFSHAALLRRLREVLDGPADHAQA
ncbi:MAG: PAS domain S-box protein [Elusimicrobiota bacterium]|jgi:PAS domain S-box-containing protein